MRTSKTLKKLRDNRLVRICGLGHYIPAFVRHAAHFGFDCIWLDLEHRAMDHREVQALLAFCHMYDIDCMVRPPTLEKTRLYRYLEDGATGLMIPFVSSVNRAKELVQAAKFPPVGNRGFDGAGLDADFSLPDLKSYAEHCNRETFLVVQIETLEAVKHLEAIVAVEGLDGVFVGPVDLTFRINSEPGKTPMIEQVQESVTAACQKHGKAWGRPAPSMEGLKDLQEQGAQLLAFGGDFLSILRELENCSKAFDQAETSQH